VRAANPRSISASSIFMRSGVIVISLIDTRAHARVGQGTAIDGFLLTSHSSRRVSGLESIRK
jgi:hypothetical protein